MLWFLVNGGPNKFTFARFKGGDSQFPFSLLWSLAPPAVCRNVVVFKHFVPAPERTFPAASIEAGRDPLPIVNTGMQLNYVAGDGGNLYRPSPPARSRPWKLIANFVELRCGRLQHPASAQWLRVLDQPTTAEHWHDGLSASRQNWNFGLKAYTIRLVPACGMKRARKLIRRQLCVARSGQISSRD